MARREPYAATLSGTMIRQTEATTTWYLYPGACVDRTTGTWSPRSNPVADSLQPTTGFPSSTGYTVGQPTLASNTIAYTRADLSLSEILWHVASALDPVNERPAIIDGSRMIWCGKFDANWLNKVGYPNLTNQILYINTGTHAAPYHLTFQGVLSSELDYDYVHFIGGGGLGQPNAADPLGNRRDYLDDIRDNGTGGPYGDSDLICSFTGSIDSPVLTTLSQGDGTVEGSAGIHTTTDVPILSYDLTIDPDHQGVYVYFVSDCLFSNEDGLWPEGQGVELDLIATSDNGPLYDDQAATGGVDAYDGNVLVGTPSAPVISARVGPGVGDLWQLTSGTGNPTADICSPQKALASDLFFEGGDPGTNQLINHQFNAVVGCTFPVPAGTASIIASWDAYYDLPPYAGYFQYAEYRFYKDGLWSNWKFTGSVRAGKLEAWIRQADELVEAARADSVQVRYVVQCGPAFTPDGQNCSNSQTNGLLYDDFGLQFVTGAVAPVIGDVGPAATTFIDGTIHGTNCNSTPCWPGPQGTDLHAAYSIDDNWNNYFGGADRIDLPIQSGLRKGGMGINWRHGYDANDYYGKGIPRTNGAYNPAYDVPRMIFRVFDPASRAWSPWDSTELVADRVSIADVDGAGPQPPDTTVIDGFYDTDWPPADKVAAGASLPDGFTINGVGSYSALAFLPRGTRMQYYFKAVDINGGVAYQFSDQLDDDVDPMPSLPCHSSGCTGPRAPDLFDWRVLPGVYAPGPSGSLLAGRSNTPILDLDDPLTGWDFGYNPVTQALRALGVRADRDWYLHLGGHPPCPSGELCGAVPNYLDYPIIDSLAAWYRIILVPRQVELGFLHLNETDSYVLDKWLRKDTGADQGDRCIFMGGHDIFDVLLNYAGKASPNAIQLAQDFGVGAATSAWSGAGTTAYPTVDDRFAAASAGPALAAANTFTYPLDGGCAAPGETDRITSKFDALTKVGGSDAQNAVFYPNSQVAGIARSQEIDNIPDKDRSKSLGLAYSLQYLRDAGYGPQNANYSHSGIENRARVLYKFLTGCRALRTSSPADTGKCWPCPSPGSSLALMQADWASQATGFQTSKYGPLYPIQAGALATGVEEGNGVQEGVPAVNRVQGNYPNPFNPQTSIRFTSRTAGTAEIRVFDVSGRLVSRLRTKVNLGENVVRWTGRTEDGAPLASGVYFYKIAFPDGQSLKAPSHLVIVK